jgi:hypothetical protein
LTGTLIVRAARRAPTIAVLGTASFVAAVAVPATLPHSAVLEL